MSSQDIHHTRTIKGLHLTPRGEMVAVWAAAIGFSLACWAAVIAFICAMCVLAG